MKQKRYSLAYWAKQNLRGFDAEPALLDAVQRYARDGEHPEVEFAGTPRDFCNALYLEAHKRLRPRPGAYPTPMPVARRMAASLGAAVTGSVLDPGAGYGNLSAAVRELGGRPLSVEIVPWFCDLADTFGLNVVCADFLAGTDPPCSFGAVIVNPPYGRCYGHTYAEVAFMRRIADLSVPGVLVAALLPSGFFRRDQSAFLACRERYEVLEQEALAPDTFAPLTGASAERCLLRVR